MTTTGRGQPRYFVGQSVVAHEATIRTSAAPTNTATLGSIRVRYALAVRGTVIALRARMLRITPLTAGNAHCLKVEGRLVGEWVEVLEREVVRAQRTTSQVELDLAGVEFADSEALALLLRVAKQGVRLAACSPLLTRLLESRAS